MELRDKVAGSLFGFNRGDSHIYLGTGQTRGLLMIARTGGVRFRCAGKGDSSFQGASKATRRTTRRAARRRPEETTVPGEKGVGVLLADSVPKDERPVSRELLPLPVPFPENEVVKKRAAAWTQSGREVACQETRGLARLGERWGA